MTGAPPPPCADAPMMNPDNKIVVAWLTNRCPVLCYTEKFSSSNRLLNRLDADWFVPDKTKRAKQTPSLTAINALALIGSTRRTEAR